MRRRRNVLWHIVLHSRAALLRAGGPGRDTLPRVLYANDRSADVRTGVCSALRERPKPQARYRAR